MISRFILFRGETKSKLFDEINEMAEERNLRIIKLLEIEFFNGNYYARVLMESWN